MNKILPKIHRLSANAPPICVQLNLTNRCVNRCKMCRKYTWPQKDLKLLSAINVISDLNSMGTNTIILSGGEPLLYDDLDVVIAQIKLSTDMDVAMITSGLGNHRHQCNSMLLKALDRIYISLDAMTQSVYKKVRGRGSLKEALAFVEFAAQVNKNVTVWTVEQKANQHDIPYIREWCAKLGVKHDVFPVHTYSDLMLKSKGNTGCNSKYCVYSYTFAIVQPTGEVLSCCKLAADNSMYDQIRKDLILGNIYIDDFMSIWHKSSYVRRRIHDERQPECVTCDRGVEVNKAYNEYLKIEKNKVFL